MLLWRYLRDYFACCYGDILEITSRVAMALRQVPNKVIIVQELAILVHLM